MIDNVHGIRERNVYKLYKRINSNKPEKNRDIKKRFARIPDEPEDSYSIIKNDSAIRREQLERYIKKLILEFNNIVMVTARTGRMRCRLTKKFFLIKDIIKKYGYTIIAEYKNSLIVSFDSNDKKEWR